MRCTGIGGVVGLLLFALAAPGAVSTAVAGEPDLLQDYCTSCHIEGEDGTLSRISEQRKTPEGWLMTLVRMRQLHDFDIDLKTQAQLVRHLSETQGLAPSETTGYRYILERDPAVVESLDAGLMEMCARCHSGARVALQRRTEEEWRHLVDFHVGQWPTTEYQALGRDREWYKIAKESIAPQLAEQFPVDNKAWREWQKAEKPQAQGSWLVRTRLPRKGEAWGSVTVSGKAQPYHLSGHLMTAGGESLSVSGQVNVYTGYEWRASVTIGENAYNQVLALSTDGESLSGRQFLSAEDSLGGAFEAVRTADKPVILSIQPAAIKVGETTRVQVMGANLGAITVNNATVAHRAVNAWGVSVEITPETEGTLMLAAEGVTLPKPLIAYSKADSLRVEPGFSIARVGDDDVKDGPLPPMRALFRATAWLNGADGEAGTDDDVSIGEVPADWSVAPFDAVSEQMQDVEFAGRMDSSLGIFTPGGAGPNPARTYSTNNAGNLKVIATSREDAGLKGEGQLLVTVQRWNDPPIR